MRITRRQLRNIINESIGNNESEATKIWSLLTSDNVGSVKQGLDLIAMLDIDPYEYRSDKQFFETLSYFLDNRKPEMVKAVYYYKYGRGTVIPAYLTSKSLQESKALYDGISYAMDYKWLSDFKFKRHFNDIFYKGHKEIRRLQIERKKIESYLISEDEELLPSWYIEDGWEDNDGDGDEKQTVMIARIGEIEQEVDTKLEVLNYEAYNAMKTIISYLDKEGQVSLDMAY